MQICYCCIWTQDHPDPDIRMHPEMGPPVQTRPQGHILAPLANGLHFNSLASLLCERCQTGFCGISFVLWRRVFIDIVTTVAWLLSLRIIPRGLWGGGAFDWGITASPLSLVLFVWPQVTFKQRNTCHWAPQAMETVAKSHLCHELDQATVIPVARF